VKRKPFDISMNDVYSFGNGEAQRFLWPVYEASASMSIASTFATIFLSIHQAQQTGPGSYVKNLLLLLFTLSSSATHAPNKQASVVTFMRSDPG
jgi:hypothetical protein